MASLSVPAEPIAGHIEPLPSASASSSSASSSSSSSTLSSPTGSGKKTNATVKTKTGARQRHRIIAACCGAVVTSLTMTPFDVIKTRLQIQQQPEAFFVPSSHVPPPTQSAASTRAAAAAAAKAAISSQQRNPTSSRYGSSSLSTTSSSSSSATTSARAKGKAPIAGPSATSAMQQARSLAATNLATCCQKTYFTTNLADGNSILCRFDPRDAGSAVATASAQASSSSSAKASSSTSYSVSSSSTPQNARPRIIPIQFETPSFSSANGHGGTLVLDTGEACIYPSPSIARQQLPNLSHPSTRHFAGFFDAIAKIVQHEGVSTLWRGLSASLVMSVPAQVIYMVGYDQLRTAALENPPLRFAHTDQIDGSVVPTKAYVATTTFVAGSVSRTAVATLLAPLELFRTRLQSTGAHISAMNVTHSVRDLVRAEGVGSLWRGLSATLWRDVPFSGAYWAGYEAIRRMLSQGRGMGEINHDDKASKTFGIAFASGAGSGMIASFLTHPFDVIKTRRQTDGSSVQKRGTLTILKEIARREGTAGLWRGMVPRVAKVAPACGIMIGAYEIGLRWTGESEER